MKRKVLWGGRGREIDRENEGGMEQVAASVEFPTAIKLFKILTNLSGGEVTPSAT
jgi:hypothetical protein